jgi:tetratricopeptide (TPR) repeat protein
MLLDVLKDLVRGRKAPVGRDVLRLALALQNASRHEEAIKVLTTLLESKPDCIEALILRGSAKRSVGRAKEGLVDLTRASALDPNNASCLYEVAVACYTLGDERLAFEYCERSRQVAPGFAEPRWLQAQITLGSEYYFDVLKRIHAHLKPRTYVEIGVFRGESLRLAASPTQAIGIDPEPQLVSPLEANHRLFTETSDAFFASRDLCAELGGLPVDLAFIDGMHHFEFALRDFINLERCCTRGSTILIHDCYPLDRETARRDGSPPFWSGDIWRLTVLLKKYRPDLAIHTIGAPPTGLGLVRNLDPESRFLIENLDQLCQEFLALDYAYLDSDKAGQLNLVLNDWEKIRALLDAP